MVVSRLLRLSGWQRAAQQEASKEIGKGGVEPVGWVSVLTVFDMVQAVLTTARLQDEGIPAHLRREAVSSVLPTTVGILGRIDVMVPEPMYDKATALIEALLESLDREGDGGDLGEAGHGKNPL